MENVSNSKREKQRRFLLVLPLLVIPFLTLAFWALGGGTSGQNTSGGKPNAGLNVELPSANLKDDQNSDKLSFYEKAKLEQEKNLEAFKNDPYFNLNDAASDSNELESMVGDAGDAYVPSKTSTGLNTSPVYSERYTDPNEAKIMSKLSQLQKEIDRPQAQTVESAPRPPLTNNSNENLSGDIDRLEEMVNMMKDKDVDDPEMQQLDNMLNKIMDIQHPDRVRQDMKEKSVQQKQKVFPVSKSPTKQNVSAFGNIGKEAAKGVGFYGTDNSMANISEQNAIEAVVHEAQVLVNGAVVKLRLLNDIFINGTLIPKDNFVFGIANLNGERLNVEINSIRYGQSLFPVKLEVHDLDGLAGIYIPGGISRDVAKQSADNTLQSIELSTLDPSLTAQAAAQAANAGVGAAKSLFSKKVKLIRVAVKAGYKVLLYDKNLNNN